jgi:hypothetical protein
MARRRTDAATIPLMSPHSSPQLPTGNQKFIDDFDEVFRSHDHQIIRTAFRAPQANGVAGRFVCTLRAQSSALWIQRATRPDRATFTRDVY